MTNEERKYLRSIFHHFDERADKSTIPDYDALVLNNNDYTKLRKAIFLTLCIQGDEDGEVVPMLKDMLIDNKIEIIK